MVGGTKISAPPPRKGDQAHPVTLLVGVEQQAWHTAPFDRHHPFARPHRAGGVYDKQDEVAGTSAADFGTMGLMGR
ncbi:MAG: hypothetical protein U0401_14865 [Anaerolineae bacterium]